MRFLLELHDWPDTKPGHVRAIYWPYAPSFPVDGEVISAIAEAPGAVPTRMDDVLFGRSAFLDIEHVGAVEETIRGLDGPLLWRQRRACTVGRSCRGHLWLELRTLTFARGPEFYCGHCLVVKFPGFYGWPVSPKQEEDARVVEGRVSV